MTLKLKALKSARLDFKKENPAKKNISVLFPLIIVPVAIVLIAFFIDISKVNLFSFVVSSCIIYAIFLASYGVTGKIWGAWLVTSVPVILIELINFYKIKINGMPFMLRDFSFGKNIHTLLEFALPQLTFSQTVLWGGIFFFLLTGILLYAERKYVLFKRSRAITACIGSMLALVLSLPWVNSAIASRGGDTYILSEDLVIKHGVITGLYCSGTKAENYNKEITAEDIRRMINRQPTKTQASDKNPTVIFLMSESFFDVDRLPNVRFSKDPIETFHKLQTDFSTGSFVSNTYCGGTGYVELEVLTGLCSYFLDEKDTLDTLPSNVYETLPCISDVFKNHGYTANFVHSYNNSLYNRPMIYSTFGFDEIRFEDDFTQTPEFSGGYLSDMTLTKEIISMYENSRQNPLMLFAVSMENHQPYTSDKYEETGDIIIESDFLNNEDMQIFESYIHGLSNADRALRELVGYFSGVSEPVMIVFWGDHLPNLNLSGGENIYSALGYSPPGESYEWHGESLMKMLTTDYVIWNNFGLEKTDKTIGSAMLGVEIMDMLGMEMTDYYKWVCAYIKDNYIMCRPKLFAVREDEIYENIPDKYSKMMKDYSDVIYDFVYGENKLFENHRN